MTFAEAVKLLERRGAVSYVGDKSVRAQCPAHGGQRTSLSVRELDGRLAVKCFSEGCDREQILAALEEIRTGPPRPLSERQRREIQARIRPDVESEQVFDLKDITGKVVATHVRVNYADGTKDVYWKGGLGGRKVTSLPLFGSDLLPLLDDEPDVPIYLCEGEKDTLALWERGIPAVGTVTGAHSIPDDDVLRCLVGRDVVLYPDNDPQGQKHMRRIAARLEVLNNQHEEGDRP